MDRRTIRNAMLELINGTLEAYIEDLNMEDLIDEDVLHDFMWQKDFGKEIVESYVDEHTEELVEDYLEEIYNEIDQDDLICPF